MRKRTPPLSRAAPLALPSPPLVRGNQKGYPLRKENTPFDLSPLLGHKKRAVQWTALIFARLANVVELQGHRALLVRGVILVKNTLCSSLVDRLHCDLVSALGLGAIFSADLSALLRSLRVPDTRTRFLADLIFGKPNTSSGWNSLRQTKNPPCRIVF